VQEREQRDLRDSVRRPFFTRFRRFRVRGSGNAPVALGRFSRFGGRRARHERQVDEPRSFHRQSEPNRAWLTPQVPLKSILPGFFVVAEVPAQHPPAATGLPRKYLGPPSCHNLPCRPCGEVGCVYRKGHSRVTVHISQDGRPRPSQNPKGVILPQEPDRANVGSVGGQVCRQRSSKELFHVAVARLHLGHCIATRRPLPLRRPFVTWRCARNVAAPGGRPKKSAERTTAVASDAARRTWGPSIASPSSRPSAASIADRRASMSCRGSAYAQAAGMARRDQERSVSTISKLQGH